MALDVVCGVLHHAWTKEMRLVQCAVVESTDSYSCCWWCKCRWI